MLLRYRNAFWRGWRGALCLVYTTHENCIVTSVYFHVRKEDPSYGVVVSNT